MTVANEAVHVIGPYGDKELYLTVIKSLFKSDFPNMDAQYKKQVPWAILPDVTLTLIPNLVIDDIVVELKVLEKIDEKAVWQLRRYMRALKTSIGILVNVSGAEGKIHCYRVTQTFCTLNTAE